MILAQLAQALRQSMLTAKISKIGDLIFFKVDGKNVLAIGHDGTKFVAFFEGPYSLWDNWCEIPVGMSNLRPQFQGLTPEHLVFGGKVFLSVFKIQKVLSQGESASAEDKKWLEEEIKFFTERKDNKGNTFKEALLNWVEKTLDSYVQKKKKSDSDIQFFRTFKELLEARPFNVDSILGDLLFIVESTLGDAKEGFRGNQAPPPCFPKQLGRLAKWDTVVKAYQGKVNDMQMAALIRVKRDAFLGTLPEVLFGLENVELSRSLILPDGKTQHGDLVWATPISIGNTLDYPFEFQEDKLSIHYTGEYVEKQRVLDLMCLDPKIQAELQAALFAKVESGKQGLLGLANKAVGDPHYKIPEDIQATLDEVLQLGRLLKERFCSPSLPSEKPLTSEEPDQKRVCLGPLSPSQAMPELMEALEKEGFEIF